MSSSSCPEVSREPGRQLASAAWPRHRGRGRRMTRLVSLAGLELRRFRTPLQRAALAFAVAVPLLYGAIYLWTNWDPYGKLSQVPVAVVNTDKPVTAQGRHV